MKHKASQSSGPAVIEPEIVRQTVEKPRLAPRYKVLLHNDDVTPMDFVVLVLMKIFKKGVTDAMGIMWAAHVGGVALVDVLPLEQAELRVEQAHSMARTRKWPLTFSYEPK